MWRILQPIQTKFVNADQIGRSVRSALGVQHRLFGRHPAPPVHRRPECIACKNVRNAKYIAIQTLVDGGGRGVGGLLDSNKNSWNAILMLFVDVQLMADPQC